MNIAINGLTLRKLSIFILILIVFFAYTTFSQEETADKTVDPLSEYIIDNDVYQGTDFTDAIKSGRQGFRNRKYEYALKKFSIAQALSTNHPVPYFFKAHCYYALGEYTSAYDELVQGFKFFPEWIRLNFDLSAEYQFDESLTEHRNALLDATSASADFKSWFVLGYVLYYTGEPERSVVAFKEVMRLLEDKDESNLALKISQEFLIFLYDRGFVGKPIEVEKSNEAKGWLRRAIQHLQNEEYEKAVVVCGEEGMKFRNAKALFWMSMFLIADDSYDYAFSMLIRAASIDPTRISEIPSISDVFSAEKLIEIKESAKTIRNKTLVELLEGNQYAVLETLKGEDSKNFSQDEIDAVYRVLKDRDEMPKMPVIDGTGKVEKPVDVIKNKTDDPDKPVNPDESAKEADLEKLKEAEEFIKKENEKKIAEALKFAKILYDERKYKEAIEQFSLVLGYGKQISDDYFKEPEHARVYVDLAKACFFAEEFEKASENLQSFLKVSNDLVKADGTIFFTNLGESSFDVTYKKLDIYCTINNKSYSAKFLKAYIDNFQNNMQTAADLFSEVYLNVSNDLAGWYLKALENKEIKPTSSPQDKALIHFQKAEQFLKDKVYDAALIEYQRVYNNLTEKDNVQTLTGILACLLHKATTEISAQKRSDSYAAASDYLRKYINEIGEDKWKTFTIGLAKKFPDNADYTNSLTTLKSHLQERAIDFDAYYLLGFVHYFAKDYKNAYNAFDKYMKTKSHSDGLEVDYFMAVCENK